MTKTQKREAWRSSLEEFLAGALAEKAGQSLSDGAALRIHIDGRPFLYRRTENKNILLEGPGEGIDAQFWLSLSTLQQLLDRAALPGTGISAMGVAVFERIFSQDPASRIDFRLETSIFGLWRKGYFSVLKAGGPEVASYFARLGQGGFSRLKDMLRKI